MKIVALSDQHGLLPDVEPCDLLLIAGDICPVSDHSTQGQVQFLAGPFKDWLERVPAEHIVGVAGNHDWVFQLEPGLVPRSLRWEYLEDRAVTVGGLRVYGTPWQPVFFDWAFNLPEDELARKWALIPADTDVLVCHGPPQGYGDMVARRSWARGGSQGSPSLTEAVRRVKPRLMVFGHIHEGRGSWEIDHGGGRKSILANVTVVDENYRNVYRPMAFEL
jgi:Icc-related predicted phosphoesterase